MNSKKSIWITVIVIAILGTASAFYYSGLNKEFFSSENEDSFSVDSLFLKTSMKPAGSFDKQIMIQNEGKVPLPFNLELIDLEGLVFPEETVFDLEAGGKKSINIVFSNSNNLEPGIYSGGLKVSANSEERFIPIILEIESEDIVFDANSEIYPKGRIYPGETLRLEVRVFDLSKIGTANVVVNYIINDFYGNTYLSDSENKVVSDQGSFSESFTLPEHLEGGDYIFGVVLKYKNSVGTSTEFFTIEGGKSSAFELDTNTSLIYIVLILIVVLFIFMAGLFYFIYSRDRLLREMTVDYQKNLRRDSESLVESEKKNEGKLKTSAEKRVNKKLFGRVRSQRKNELKRQYKERVKKIKKLRKSKKPKSEIQKQIQSWKKNGFDTAVLDKKYKTPSVDDIKNQLSSFKRKGYDTSVLEGSVKNKK
jgi:hypothetical protein